ncbi:hypothetical protein PCAU_1932 [Pseudomonas chlororaphis subsp. aurantiaca]|uniref:hypothetical protein n=1 Tax=Pseudomonas chlororaphis TaxID=587753 RepID=UPI00086593D2|nr:hypothetical protein [Pseudomonas chlororaphis]BAV74141.1 hypothetical protein PCAU_1932 [Pseudomonas chlororaphis subsp. aurantiaca]
MGLLTSMRWGEVTLLDLLNDVEKDTVDSFEVVHLELNSGRSYVVAVIHGEPDQVDEIAEKIEGLKRRIGE